MRAGRKLAFGEVFVFRLGLAVTDVQAGRTLRLKTGANGVVDVYRAFLSLSDLSRHWSFVPDGGSCVGSLVG